MRNSLISAVVLLCMGVLAGAQTPNKVGVINIQGAVVGTKDGQKASQELEAKFGPKSKEFQSRQAELGQLQDQLNKGGTVMSEDKRAQLAREIDEKKRRLERDMQDAEEEIRAEQQKVLSGLGQRLIAVLEKYAKDNGYSLILDEGNQNTPVIYSSKTIDITQDIINLYDKNPPPAGSSAPAPAAPGAPKPH